MSCAAVLSMRLPWKRIEPALGRMQPGDGPQGRRLPGTVGADEGDHLALIDGEADPLDGLDLAVRDDQVLDLEHGAHSLLLLVGGAADVGLDDSRVGLHLVRGPLDEDLPADETEHPVAEVEDEAHVVLDDHDRQSAVADPEDQVARLLRLLGFMPAVGSSSRRSFGSVARARAISRRRWSP